MCVPGDVFLIKEQDELPKLVAVLTEQSVSTHLKQQTNSPSPKVVTLLSASAENYINQQVDRAETCDFAIQNRIYSPPETQISA